jgi:hypothetical protein
MRKMCKWVIRHVHLLSGYALHISLAEFSYFLLQLLIHYMDIRHLVI